MFTTINTKTTKVLMNDASRPWAVMFTPAKGSRKIIGRYATEAQAKRRAKDENRTGA